MVRKGRARAALLLAFAMLAVPVAPADATRIRPGTISFGAVADYGLIRGDSFLSSLFDHGLGGEFRVGYRMRHGRTVGATFGEQFYNSSVDTLNQAQIITAGLEFGQYFGSPEHPFYFVLGAGVWNPTVQAIDNTFFEKNKTDHIYLSGTLGTEVFVRRTVALDISIRGRIHQDNQLGYPFAGDTSGSASRLDKELQIGAGIHIYVLD